MDLQGQQQRPLQQQQQQRPWSEKMIDLHVYVVPSEIWRDQYNNMDNNDVSESLSLGFIRIHPESRVFTLRDEILLQLESPNLPQNYVFLKSVGRCLTKVKQHQEHQLKAKHFLPQLNSSHKYGNELYLLETANRGNESSTANSIQTSSDQRSSSNNDHMTGGPGHHLPYLQTPEQLKKVMRVAPPHQRLKHIAPNSFDPHTNSHDILGSPNYQFGSGLGSKLVDESNYFLEDAAMAPASRAMSPLSKSLTPTTTNNSNLPHHQRSRRNRRRRHQQQQQQQQQRRHNNNPRAAATGPGAENVAVGNGDENDEDNDDNDDELSTPGATTLHSYSEPPYFHNHHHPYPSPSTFPHIHSYPYLLDDPMLMLPLSRGTPRYYTKLRRHVHNNNNKRRSRSPTTVMSLPTNQPQHSTRQSKEKPKDEELRATTEGSTSTRREGGREGDPRVGENVADEKRIREMRAREELKREQEEQERWERLNSGERNIESGLTNRTESEQEGPGVSEDGILDKNQQQPLSPSETNAKTKTGQEQEQKAAEERTGAEDVEGKGGEREREEKGKGNTKQRSHREKNNQRPPESNVKANTKKGNSSTPEQKPSEPETARSRKEDSEKLYEVLESVREQRKSKERQREELVKRAKSLQGKIQNRRNHARDMWKKKYYEEKKKTSPHEEQCNKFRHELDVIHRKYISSLEPAKEKPTKITAKKPSEKNNIIIQASRLKHDTDELRRRVDNAKMKLTAELKLRNQTEIELRALKGELIQQKINLNLIRKQQFTGGINQGGNNSLASNDLLLGLKQPIVQHAK